GGAGGRAARPGRGRRCAPPVAGRRALAGRARVAGGGVPDPPTGAVTFLFTDLEGQTSLWAQHAEQMAGSLARHDAILRGAVAGHGGYVVKRTGDGVHAAFARAPDALGAALDVQRALTTQTWDLPRPLRARMGLHTGACEERDGDYGPAPV